MSRFIAPTDGKVILQLSCFDERAEEENGSRVVRSLPVIVDEQKGQPGKQRCDLGCPWCRRPLQCDVRPLSQQDLQDIQNNEKFLNNEVQNLASENRAMRHQIETLTTAFLREKRKSSKFAFCSVLFGGPTAVSYFLGALVLAYSLKNRSHPLVLLVTEDIPEYWLVVLRCFYDQIVPVEYLSMYGHISTRLFQNPQYTRFKHVFTKLQIFTLDCYDKVVFLDLDMLVRQGKVRDLEVEVLENVLFCSEHSGASGAHKRGNPPLQHGEQVSYESFWRGYAKRKWNSRKDEVGEDAAKEKQVSYLIIFSGNFIQ